MMMFLLVYMHFLFCLEIGVGVQRLMTQKITEFTVFHNVVYGNRNAKCNETFGISYRWFRYVGSKK